MTNLGFDNKVREIIEYYIKMTADMESTFRKRLSKSIGISEDKLYSLPQELYNMVRIYGIEYDSVLHRLFTEVYDDENNKYARYYYDKTIESFGEALGQNQVNGIEFETLLVSYLQEHAEKINSDIVLKIKDDYGFQGIGFQGGHGDIRIIDWPVAFDAKYSAERAEIIRGLTRKGQPIPFDNTKDIEEQILNELDRGFKEAITFNIKEADEWIEKYNASWDLWELGNRELAGKVYMEAYETTKNLFYIFKDGGFWASTVMRELEPRLIKNARAIRERNGINNSTRKAMNKSMLWYADFK